MSNWQLQLLFLIAPLWLFAQQSPDFAIELAAFDQSVPLSYFKDIPNVYETYDIHQIYRYHIAAANKDEAEQLLSSVKKNGFPNARIIDFVKIRKLCESQCGYTSPQPTGIGLKSKPKNSYTPPQPIHRAGGLKASDLLKNSNNNIIKQSNNPLNTKGNQSKSDNESTLNHNQHHKTPSHSDNENNPKFSNNILSTDNGSTNIGSDVNIETASFVLFEFGSTQLASYSKNDLQKVLQALQKNDQLTIELIGHADAIGSTSKNQTLSLQRALQIKQYLLDNNIHKHRIKTFAKGEITPIAINNNLDGSDSPEGRKYNRRVDLKVLDPDGNIVQIISLIVIPKELRQRK